MLSARPCSILRLAVLLCALGGALLAQIGGGSVVGNVADQSGAAIPNATITIINTETNIRNTTNTNVSGYYEFPLLPAGRYVIEAEATGFSKTKVDAFTLNTGTRPRFDLKLGVKEMVEQITVEGTAPMVNATTTDLGVVMEQHKIQELPLNGRNYQQLVGLQAGVINRPNTQTGGRGGIEFNGSPSFGNNLMMDGIDMSFGESNSAGAAAGLSGNGIINTLSVEAIEEFKTAQSAFAAEYGRATGGVLNITTKSGTNTFHGALFEFFRNDKLDANSYENNRRSIANNPWRQNQFGANLGGPVWIPKLINGKDKLFFFFNYEAAIARKAVTYTGNTPTQLLRDSVTPALKEHMASMPTYCDYPIAGNPYVCHHYRVDKETYDEWTNLARVDYATGAHRLALRYNYTNQDYSRPNSIKEISRINYPVRSHNALVQETWTISSRMFNEVRAGYSRFDMDRRSPTLLTEPAFFNVPLIGDSDFQSRLWTLTNTYQLADNFTFIKGRHTIKAGLDMRDMRARRNQATNPTHYYADIPSLIADKPFQIRLTGGNPGRGYTSLESGFFIQDDFRVNRRLQINAGLRYEYYTPLTGAWPLATRNPFGAFATNHDPMYQADANNFGPRLGLVFDVTGNQKLVIRTGAGITFAPQQPFFYYDQQFISPVIPFSANLNTSTDIPPGVATSFPFPQAYINALIANPALLPKGLLLGRNVTDPGRRDEYAGQWNFAVQSAISREWSVQATYSASRGINLLNTEFPNLILPNGQRPVPTIGEVNVVTSEGRSFYNSLQMQSTYRGKRGTTFNLYYTLGKNMTYAASDMSEGPRQQDIQDFSNIAGSTGPKAGDIRHIVTAVYTYEVPLPSGLALHAATKALLGGWNLQGIISWRTGISLNPVTGLDLVGNGRNVGTRPDVIAGSPIYASDQTPPGNNSAFTYAVKTWLNQAAFDARTPKALKRFGSASYNMVYGPHAAGFDGSVNKYFRITENHRVQFRAEFFNAFNHPNDSNPDMTSGSNLSFPNLNVNPTFGVIMGKGGNRNIQLALKYMF